MSREVHLDDGTPANQDRTRDSAYPPAEEPVVVPYLELSPEALRSVVESFVLREGTDYGDKIFSLQEKHAHVMQQLARGIARIVFDPNTETVDIITAPQLHRG